jgi:hypothetical protein
MHMYVISYGRGHISYITDMARSLGRLYPLCSQSWGIGVEYRVGRG